jgi:hypothetical protein
MTTNNEDIYDAIRESKTEILERLDELDLVSTSIVQRLNKLDELSWKIQSDIIDLKTTRLHARDYDR